MSYVIEHSCLGFCWWDLAALIVLLAVIALFVWNHQKQKKLIKELEEKLTDTSFLETDI